MKWRRRKFTFMVIPDANSQVVRFQLSAVTLVCALVLSIILAAGTAVALVLYGNRSGEVARLKQQLTAAAGHYENIIKDKDRHIGDLQTEVAGLSEQAKAVLDKMASIKNLENQLKEIAGIGTAGKTKILSVPDEVGSDGDYSMDGGTGGEELPVTDEAMDSLLDETRQDFSALSDSIDQLAPRLEQTKKAVLQRQKELRVTPTIWPTDSRHVTSLFGIRRDPFTHRATFHAGIDISGDTGDPIYAAADGTVVSAERDGGHGNSVLVSHGNGITTRYSHLSKILTTAGAKVKKGQIVGLMGSTGRSTGPHLHYEVTLNGEHVDPRPYLQSDRKEP